MTAESAFEAGPSIKAYSKSQSLQAYLPDDQ